MTVAVCFRCGGIKFGAWVPCPECEAMPRSEDEMVVSLAMTDHYFDRHALEELGREVAAGKLPRLDPATRERMAAVLREAEEAAKRAGMPPLVERGGDGAPPP